MHRLPWLTSQISGSFQVGGLRVGLCEEEGHLGGERATGLVSRNRHDTTSALDGLVQGVGSWVGFCYGGSMTNSTQAALKRLPWQVVGLAALVGLVACSDSTAFGAPGPQAEVKVQGEVVENIRLYEMNGPGVLRVRVDEGLDTPDEEVLVTYSYGDQAPCGNEAIFEQARAIRRGTPVEVKGYLHGDHNLTLCESSDAYVRPL